MYLVLWADIHNYCFNIVFCYCSSAGDDQPTAEQNSICLGCKVLHILGDEYEFKLPDIVLQRLKNSDGAFLLKCSSILV